MKDHGSSAFWGFVLGVAATLVVFWLVIAGLRAAVVLVIPSSTLSTRAAGHGSAFYRTSPGDRARRGTHYLSIGSSDMEGRRFLCASCYDGAAMVLPPAKQYGVSLTPTLPIDSNFLPFLHKREIPRPVVDRQSAPGRAVSPGVEPGA